MKTDRMEYDSPKIEVINLLLEGAVLFNSVEGGFGSYVPGNGNGEDI